MSFLAPILLIGLPLALVPVVIHLIHLMRRRQVKWAAMMRSEEHTSELQSQ